MRIIFVDEAKDLNKETIAKLTDMRSSGVLAPSDRKTITNPRTRMIFITAPKSRIAADGSETQT